MCSSLAVARRGVSQASAEIFDSKLGRFTQVASMTLARAGHTAVLLRSGKVLIVGGTDASAMAELYDPIADSFSPAAATAELRRDHTATLLDDGSVLILGGRDAAAAHASAERYDPATKAFVPFQAMPKARHSHTTSVLKSGKLLVVGGFSKVDFSTANGDVLSLDATTGAFTKVASFKTPAFVSDARHSATVLPSGKALLVSQTAARFDPANNTLSPVAGVNAMTLHSASLLPNGDVLLAGGHDYTFSPNGPSGPVFAAQIFRPSNSSVSTDALSTPRAFHSATLLPTGNVLLSGGGTGADQFALAGKNFGKLKKLGVRKDVVSDATATLLPGGNVLVQAEGKAQVFDAKSKTFGATSTPVASRKNAAAVLLRSGQVLLCGGTDTKGAPLASTELFDPAAASGVGAFVATGSMLAARTLHSATLLPSGKVLVAGGSGASGELSSSELFDPTTGKFSAAAQLKQARSNHRGVLLTTGEVLLVGGTGAALSAETYDPDADGFALTTSLALPRVDHTLTLLPSGRVLVAGGADLAVAEIYDPIARGFTVTDELGGRRLHAASLLPTGQVLLTAGRTPTFLGSLGLVQIFDPAANGGAGRFFSQPWLGADQIRHRHVSVTLASGQVLIALGERAFHPPFFPEPDLHEMLWSDGLDNTRRPKLTSAPTTAVAGTTVSISGTGFLGGSEASSGASNGSATGFPIAAWRPLSGQGLVYGTLTEWTDTAAQWTVPATALFGRGLLYVITNGIPSAGLDVEIQPPPIAVGCQVDAECASGFCADGVCCDTECSGPCDGCTAARKGGGVDGTCGPVPPGLDTTDDCALGNGPACSSGDECASGNCVDGVCCDKPCTEQCGACAEPGALGQCIAVVGQPRGGRSKCAEGVPSQPCTAQACNGTDLSSCSGFVGADLQCQAASCDKGEASLVATCDGAGACAEPIRISCAPNGCDGDVCRTGPCTSDADCHPNYRCSKGVGADVGECVLANATECDGDHTLISADGSTVDCFPAKCTPAGTCATPCTSSLECVQGRACSAGGKCVPNGNLTDTTGCGCSAPGTRRPLQSSTALALLLLIGLRRQLTERAHRLPP